MRQSPVDAAPRPLAQRLHRYVGLAAVVPLLLSIAIALGLTHVGLLHALSARLFPSLPFTSVALAEPLRPGSLEQVVALVTLAHGSAPRVVTLAADGLTARVGGFGDHHGAHRPSTGPSPDITYLVDTRRMAITRVEDETNSLFILAHRLHNYDLAGIPRLNLGTVTALALLLLLASGWRLRAATGGSRLGRWHTAIGRLSALLVAVVAITTLVFEFPELLPADAPAGRPLPALSLTEPLRPHSIDQAAALAERIIGSRPHALYLRDDGTLKFSEFAEDRWFKAIYLDGASMRPTRLEDAGNNYLSLLFLLHDGRYLGGMERFNIGDLIALALLFSTLSGALLYARSRRSPAP